MKDKQARDSATEAARVAAEAKAIGEVIKTEFLAFTDEIKRSLHAQVTEELARQVRPITTQIAELKAAVERAQSRGTDESVKRELKDLGVRLLKTEASLQRIKQGISA